MFDANFDRDKAALEHNLKQAETKLAIFNGKVREAAAGVTQRVGEINQSLSDLDTKGNSDRNLFHDGRITKEEKDRRARIRIDSEDKLKQEKRTITQQLEQLKSKKMALEAEVSSINEQLLTLQKKDTEPQPVVQPAVPEQTTPSARPVEEVQVTAAPTVEEPAQLASVEQPEIQETEVEKAKREVLEAAKKCETIAEIDKIFVDIRNNRPDIWLLIHDNDPNNVKHSEILAVLGDLLLNQANEDERRRGAGARTMGVYMSSLTQLLATKFPYDWARYKR